jgi:hypothetical protein
VALTNAHEDLPPDDFRVAGPALSLLFLLSANRRRMAVDASLSRQLLKALKNAAQLSEIERLLQAGAHPHYSKVAGFR